jgi:hypothetical protein
MVQTAPKGAAAPQDIEHLLSTELEAADTAFANTRPILRHLLRNDDHSIFSDQIVARVRGMLHDVARQLVVALAEAGGERDPQAGAHEAAEELAGAFLENPAMLGHAHALAIEWQLTERLHTRLSLDPVLSPLVQEMISSGDPATSSSAMALLAAQARFGQNQRRMELPVTELPGDLFHAALMTMHAHAADLPGENADADAAKAEEALRKRYEERRSRLGLTERLITALRGDAAKALSIEHVGAALFLTALAIGSGQDRDHIIMTTTETQLARLALSLAACGLKADAVAAQFLALHPDVDLPQGIEALLPDRAAAILAQAGEAAGR